MRKKRQEMERGRNEERFVGKKEKPLEAAEESGLYPLLYHLKVLHLL